MPQDRRRHLDRDLDRIDKELADVSRNVERAVAFIVENDADKIVLAPVKEKLLVLQQRKQVLEAERANLRVLVKDAHPAPEP